MLHATHTTIPIVFYLSNATFTTGNNFDSAYIQFQSIWLLVIVLFSLFFGSMQKYISSVALYSNHINYDQT